MPQGCLRETRENIDAKKTIIRSATPGKAREEGSAAWKQLRMWTWKLRAQEHPFGAQVPVFSFGWWTDTHGVDKNASLLHLKGMLRSGVLSGLIAWAWNGTAGVWETVCIYYKPVCSPGCTSIVSTGRIRPFRKGMSCCSAGQSMSLPPLLVTQGMLRLLFQ